MCDAHIWVGWVYDGDEDESLHSNRVVSNIPQKYISTVLRIMSQAHTQLEEYVYHGAALRTESIVGLHIEWKSNYSGPASVSFGTSVLLDR